MLLLRIIVFAFWKCGFYATSLPSSYSIRFDCVQIIDALPTYFWNFPSNFEYLKVKKRGDPDIDDYSPRIRNYLQQRCMIRYRELIAQSNRHWRIMRGYTKGDTLFTSEPKQNLIVLNVDGTILDQHGMFRSEMEIPPNYLKKHCGSTVNERDLIFSIMDYRDCHRRLRPHLMVYRPFLMRFIRKNQETANIIIYTINDRSFLFYHVVLIEMYFNYVLRLTRYRKAPFFQFDAVIGRAWSVPFKSLRVLDAVIGDLTRFETVQIVDNGNNDGVDSEWKNQVPTQWISNSVYSESRKSKMGKVFPFEAPEFDLMIRNKTKEEYIEYLIRYRNQDTFFQDLISSQRMISMYHPETRLRNDTLQWVKHEEVLTAFRKKKKQLEWQIDTKGLMWYQ